MADLGDFDDDLEQLLHEELSKPDESAGAKRKHDERDRKRYRSGTQPTEINAAAGGDGILAVPAPVDRGVCPPHPGFINGICIRCGALKPHDQPKLDSGVVLSYIHSGLEISGHEANRLRDAASARVLAGRRLLLVLDLDHTLLNSTRYCDLSQVDGEKLERMLDKNKRANEGVGGKDAGGDETKADNTMGGGRNNPGRAAEANQIGGGEAGASKNGDAAIKAGADARRAPGDTGENGGPKGAEGSRRGAPSEGSAALVPRHDDATRLPGDVGADTTTDGIADDARVAVEETDASANAGSASALAGAARDGGMATLGEAPSGATAGAGGIASGPDEKATTSETAAGAKVAASETAAGAKDTVSETPPDAKVTASETAADGCLFALPQIHMWTKLRPGCLAFLERAARLFELTVYTMGDRGYADAMAAILDPAGKLFHRRVISASDSTSRGEKDLDVVLGNERSVLIVDDTPGVWPRASRNLLRVPRYTFFPGDAEKFGVRKGAWLARDEDEPAEDGVLARIFAVLEEVHDLFFQAAEKAVAETEGAADAPAATAASARGAPVVALPDVRKGLASVRRRILAGVVILFSAVIPLGSPPEEHPAWKLAEELGARCVKEKDQDVTHVVAPTRSDKASWGKKHDKLLVTPAWLTDSGLHWKRAKEQEYPIP